MKKPNGDGKGLIEVSPKISNDISRKAAYIFVQNSNTDSLYSRGRINKYIAGKNLSIIKIPNTRPFIKENHIPSNKRAITALDRLLVNLKSLENGINEIGRIILNKPTIGVLGKCMENHAADVSSIYIKINILKIISDLGTVDFIFSIKRESEKFWGSESDVLYFERIKSLNSVDIV